MQRNAKGPQAKLVEKLPVWWADNGPPALAGIVERRLQPAQQRARGLKPARNNAG
jgi:hypothetical protein